MKLTRARIIQVVSIFIVQVISLIILAWIMPGFQINSLASAIGIAIVYSIAQAVIWAVFVNFLSILPAVLYPVITFVLTGFIVYAWGISCQGLRSPIAGPGWALRWA